MSRTKRVVYILAIVVITLACAPLLPQPVVFPTNGPGAIDTFVAATYGAAGTQTAEFAPTSTSTSTTTPTPSNTPTETPVPTSTIIFRLPVTFTPVKAATSTKKPAATSTSSGGGGGGGGGGGSTETFACSVVSVTPANNTKFAPNAPFTAKWKVKNIGDIKWDHNSVDYLYVSGKTMHTQALYDLPADVAINASTTLAVSMQAPAAVGTYSTTWSLRVGTDKFCAMKITIRVE